MSYTVTEVGTITVETGGGFAGDWGSGWSSSNYYHITDLDTAGAAQLHSFVLFYKGTQTNTGTTDVAIPLFGDKTNSGAIILGIDNGYVAVSDGTTITRGTSLVNDDEWQSIVFTVGDTTINAYVNGTKEVTITPTTSEMSNIIINAIGYAAGTSVGPSGLDGIQVYDRFLFDFMVADYESNIYPNAATPGSTATFITENLIVSQQPTQETVNKTVPIDTDFVPIPVQTNDSMAIMEVQLGNTTLEDDIIFTKVYMNHNLNNEEDKLAHRVNVVVPFAVLQKVREKWS